MNKYEANFFADQTAMVRMLVALLQYYEATDHLYYELDSKEYPKEGYEFDDAQEVWDRMGEARRHVRQAITDAVRKNQCIN